MAEQSGNSAGSTVEPSVSEVKEVRQFPCEGCGADLEFHIGQQRLKCPFCGFEKEIAFAPEQSVQEQDLDATLRKLSQGRTSKSTTQLADRNELKCSTCGATVVFEGTLTSSNCDYCGSVIQRADVHQAVDRIPVDGVLSFLVEEKQAKENLRAWVKSRWFAPNEFKRRGVQGKFNGIYLPYWTFDAMTHSQYSGERGDHYYVEVGSGQNKRRERRTRWTPVSGAFSRFFDDVLICAARAVKRALLQALEPWPTEKAVPFASELLAGYRAMTYDIELPEGFGMGKERMEEMIRAEVRRRIGGDEQRIHAVATQFAALTYKHLLLPIWMLAYRYGDKSYQVVVNATTGEVQGERPWSWIKITFAVLLGAAVAAAIYFATNAQ